MQDDLEDLNELNATQAKIIESPKIFRKSRT